MKNQDFKLFFQRANADPMQIDEEEAKRMQGEVLAALAKPLNRLISSHMGALFFLASVMVGLAAPLMVLVLIAGTFVFDPSQRDAIDVSKTLGVVAWLAIGLAIFRLYQRIEDVLHVIEKTDALLSLVGKNDRLVSEAIDICSMVPKAQEVLSGVYRAHRSFRVMHLNAMRRLDTQNLVAQKVFERQEKAKAQDAEQRLAQRQMLQNLAT